MIKTLSALSLSLVLIGSAHANLDIHVSGGTLGGSVQIDLIGDAGETYLIFVSDDPNNLIKWSDITINTPGFVGGLNGSGLASATLPLPGAKVLDGFQLYFQAITVNGPPYVVDDTSPLCAMKLAEPLGIVASNASLTTARTNGALAELPDGRVLITGGGGGTIFSPAPVSSADIYDPCTDSITPSSGTMSSERAFHTTTVLADGRVLVAGGADAALAITPTMDIYDPVADQFSATTPLSRARIGHTATAQSDGTVWIVGGTNALLPDYLAFLFGNTAGTEIWDPVTGSVVPGPILDWGPRAFHTAVTLNDGKILFSGGYSISDNFGFPIAIIASQDSLWDPVSGSFVPSFLRSSGTVGHSATMLGDGRVLLAGGATAPVETTPTTAFARIYDPVTDAYSIINQVMSTPRGLFPMFQLDDGRVALFGGVTGNFTAVSATDVVEIFDPTTETFSLAPDPLGVSRAASQGIRLSNGRILVIGGSNASETPQLSADLFVQ
ncbi:MAG: hypothetical protein RL885_19815 [Planctomycetota bacterium]